MNDGVCSCKVCEILKRDAIGNGYAVVCWTTLAPGEKEGGRTLSKEARFYDAEHAGRTGAKKAAEEKAGQLRARGLNATAHG